MAKNKNKQDIKKNNIPNIPVATSTKDEDDNIKDVVPVIENTTAPMEETPAVTVDAVDLKLSGKLDEKIKALRDVAFDKKDFGVEMWIPTEELLIDDETQRGIIVGQVEKILNEFNPSSFGRITVSKRKNGYYVTNGQHRLIALRKIGIEKAPCIVVDNPFEDEKEMKRFDAVNFLEINQNSQSVRAIDKYRIGVSAQLPDWMNVKEVLDENGLRAGTTRNSVNALACIHRYINSSKNPITINRKKKQMSNALRILSQSVGIPEITHVSLQAVCIVVREYVDTGLTTPEKLMQKFSKIDLQKLISVAITMKNSGTQKNVVTGLAQMLVQEYNNKCRKEDEKLPIDRLFTTEKREHMTQKIEDLEQTQ